MLGSNVHARGGLTGLDIPMVKSLPPCPDSNVKMVFWADIYTLEDGTGDNQIWVCYAPQTEYYPLQSYTSLSGVPIIEE